MLHAAIAFAVLQGGDLVLENSDALIAGLDLLLKIRQPLLQAAALALQPFGPLNQLPETGQGAENGVFFHVAELMNLIVLSTPGSILKEFPKNTTGNYTASFDCTIHHKSERKQREPRNRQSDEHLCHLISWKAECDQLRRDSRDQRIVDQIIGITAQTERDEQLFGEAEWTRAPDVRFKQQRQETGSQRKAEDRQRLEEHGNEDGNERSNAQGRAGRKRAPSRNKTFRDVSAERPVEPQHRWKSPDRACEVCPPISKKSRADQSRNDAQDQRKSERATDAPSIAHSPNQWIKRVELDFDREAPERAVDRGEPILPVIVDEKEV